jgi:hypothetical protein
MDRRRVLAAAAIVPLLHGCYYEREYPLSWDEEVLLHDGRMIIVRVTRYFTRSTSLPWLQTNYFLKDMEIAFDAGPPWGRFQRRFIGYEVELIDTKNGDWYLKLGDAAVGPRNRIVKESAPFLILVRDGKERPALSLQEIPNFPRYNVLPYVGPREDFFRFRNTSLKWDAKMKFWRDHPRSPGDVPERRRYNPNEGDTK